MNRYWMPLCFLLSLTVSAQEADEIIPPSKNVLAGLDLPAAAPQSAPAPTPSAAAVASSVSAALPATPRKPLDPVKAESAARVSAAVATLVSQTASAASGALETIHVYSQDELITLIEQDQHLKRVVKEECQLSNDIEARAKVLMLPSYQYLWADMLLTGTCTKRDPELGVAFLSDSANQGFPPALQKLANFYFSGRFVQKDNRQAAVLMHEAAALGYIPARIAWVAMLNHGLGSPLDYEEAYSWLHHSVIGDDKQHAEAARLLKQLSARMPPNVVDRAKRYQLD